MSSIFPGSASVGQIFEGYLFNGTAWDLIGNEFNPTSFSPDAPDNPKAGDLWVDSDSDVPSISNETILTIDSASATYATKAELENLDVDLTGYLTEFSASTIYATKTELDNIDLSSASAAAVAAIVDSAPATLDTLNELAAALGDDENFATTVTTSLSNKLDISTASSTYSTIVDPTFTNNIQVNGQISLFSTASSGYINGFYDDMFGGNVLNVKSDYNVSVVGQNQSGAGILNLAPSQASLLAVGEDAVAEIRSSGVVKLVGTNGVYIGEYPLTLDKEVATIGDLNEKASTGKAIAMSIVFGS